MKKLPAILFLLAACLAGQAANVEFTFANIAGGADYFRLATSTNKLRLTPLDNPKVVNGIILGKDYLEYLPNTNGYVLATNVQPGVYLCAIKIRYVESSFWISVTNTTNTLQAGAITTVPTNVIALTATTYSRAAQDMRFPVLGGIPTNGQILVYYAPLGVWFPSNNVASGSSSITVSTEGSGAPSGAVTAPYYVDVSSNPNVLYVRRPSGSFTATMQIADAGGSTGSVTASSGTTVSEGTGAPTGSGTVPFYIQTNSAPNVLWLKRVAGSYTALFEL